jgi:hypothetical protein
MCAWCQIFAVPWRGPNTCERIVYSCRRCYEHTGVLLVLPSVLLQLPVEQENLLFNSETPGDLQCPS